MISSVGSRAVVTTLEVLFLQMRPLFSTALASSMASWATTAVWFANLVLRVLVECLSVHKSATISLSVVSLLVVPLVKV